jgi:hypothetical protein
MILNESSKFQAPISKEAPMAKLQVPRRLFESAPWSLELGTWDFFGAWDLELGT